MPKSENEHTDTTSPPRPADAMTGSEFAAEVQREKYSQIERDQRVLYELLSGNFPTFYRRLVDVTVNETLSGVSHSVTYRVMPDYLAIGSDDDYLRMPMTPLTAQTFGDAFGFMLPTPKMVDQLHDAAKVKLKPSPFESCTQDFELFVQINDTIQRQLAEAKAEPGSLVDGDKKDVVTSAQIHTHPGKVVLYGWHCVESDCKCGNTIGMWQPLYACHDISYMDYSHGLRMVSKTVTVDGQPMQLVDLLKDPELCKLVSGEGRISYPRYEGAATTPKPPPGKSPAPPPYVPPPDTPPSVADRGRSAWHSARIEINRGVTMYGQGKSWETKGKNDGELVNQYQRATEGQPGYEWCGCFVGYNYKNAGFDGDSHFPASWNVTGHEEDRITIFLSAIRLQSYLEHSGCPYLTFEALQSTKRPKSQAECMAWLDEHLASFAPQPGDVLLMHTSNGDYKHVGMVASYDPKTYELVAYEGNHGDRAGAFRYSLSSPSADGYFRVNMIGRFRSEEFTHDPTVSPSGPSPDPVIE